jgi:hypothetical protein
LSYAIIDFLNLSSDNFQNNGTIYTQINDYRARIAQLRLVFTKVRLTIENPEIDSENLIVKSFAKPVQKLQALTIFTPKKEK